MALIRPIPSKSATYIEVPITVTGGYGSNSTTVDLSAYSDKIDSISNLAAYATGTNVSGFTSTGALVGINNISVSNYNPSTHQATITWTGNNSGVTNNQYDLVVVIHS